MIVEALAYARKHCSPSNGLRKFHLSRGNSFSDSTMAEMRAACKREGKARIDVS